MNSASEPFGVAEKRTPDDLNVRQTASLQDQIIQPVISLISDNLIR